MSWLEANPVVPVVLPPVDIPADNRVTPVEAGAEIMKLLLDQPAEIIPAAEILKLVRAWVLEDSDRSYCRQHKHRLRLNLPL